MLGTILTSSDLETLNAKVEIYRGSTSTPTYTCMCEDFLESFAVYREGDTSKLFGFGVCHKLDCKLIDLDRVITIAKGDTIKIGFGNKNTDSWDYPFPTLYVTEHTTDEKNNTISLTAHDKLYFASEHFLEELNLLGSPTTPKDVFTACGAALGIPTINWAEARSINLLHEDTPNFGGDEDLRTVMNYVAEVTGNIYFIGEDDSLKLRAVRVSEPVKAIGKANYYELSVKEAVVLKNICSVTELGENLEPHTTIEEGVMQYLKENPFLNLTDDAATLVDNLAAAVQGLATWQVNCDWEGNHLLEIGDCIAFEKNDGSTVVSILLNDTLQYSGYLNQVTEWEFTQDDAETATNSTTLGDKLNETYAKVNKLDKQITLYVSELTDNQEETKERVAALEITTGGITSTVSQVQTTLNGKAEATDVASLRNEVSTKLTSEQVEFIVTTELSEGVDRVTTTSKKYTFDDEGLNISSTDSNLSTAITEDGMKIYRQSTEVLVADNEGVKAEDLQATTFLIIGDNSRFEDFENAAGDRRTACFWIGG